MSLATLLTFSSNRMIESMCGFGGSSLFSVFFYVKVLLKIRILPHTRSSLTLNDEVQYYRQMIEFYTNTFRE